MRALTRTVVVLLGLGTTGSVHATAADNNKTETLWGWTPDGTSYLVLFEQTYGEISEEFTLYLRDLATGKERTLCSGGLEPEEGAPSCPATGTEPQAFDEKRARKLKSVVRLKLTLTGQRTGTRLGDHQTTIVRKGKRLVFRLHHKGVVTTLGESEELDDASDLSSANGWGHTETRWEAKGRALLFEISYSTGNGYRSRYFGFQLARPVELPAARAERPSPARLLDLDLPDEKLSALAKAVEGSADQVARALNTRGMRFYRRKQHQRAARAFELAAITNPRYELPLFNRACVAGLQRDAAAAAAWLRKLRALATTSSQKLIHGAAKEKDLDAVRGSREVKAALAGEK